MSLLSYTDITNQLSPFIKINFNLPENPKELLEKLTFKTQKGKYDENDAVKIFQILDFNTIYKTHKGEYSFQSFADELKAKSLIDF